MDNLANLPPDVLNQIALAMSLADVGSLCITSRSLSEVCQRESFWVQRLAKDFPMYPPPQPLPPTLTYRDYYRGLWKALQLKDTNGELIFRNIPLSREQRPLLLVYPVPRFELNSNKMIKPDVKIDWFSNNIIIVSVKNRRLRTGESLPNLLSNVPVLNDQDLTSNSRLAFREVARASKGRYDEFYLVNGPEYNSLLEQARKLGFKMLLVGDIDEPIKMNADPQDPDLFFGRMSFVFDKRPIPIPLQQGPVDIPPILSFDYPSQQAVDSPPVPKKKVNKLFGFLSSD